MSENDKIKLLFTETLAENELLVLVQKLIPELSRHKPFCLLLEGPLGSGKTTFSRLVLQGLGLSSKEAVVSPTYTYLNEYQIADKFYAHCDFYRLKKMDLLSDELEFCQMRKFSGYLLEWPKFTGEEDSLKASHRLVIETVKGDKKKRSYKFFCLS